MFSTSAWTLGGRAGAEASQAPERGPWGAAGSFAKSLGPEGLDPESFGCADRSVGLGARTSLASEVVAVCRAWLVTPHSPPSLAAWAGIRPHSLRGLGRKACGFCRIKLWLFPTRPWSCQKMWSIHRPAPGLPIIGQRSWENGLPLPPATHQTPSWECPRTEPPPLPLLAPKVLSATWPCTAQKALCGPGVQGQTDIQTDRQTQTETPLPSRLLPGSPQAGDIWPAPGLAAPLRGCNPACPAQSLGCEHPPFTWGTPGPQDHLVRTLVHLTGAHSLGEAG